MGATGDPKPKSHDPKPHDPKPHDPKPHDPKYSPGPKDKGGLESTDPEQEGMVPLWIDLATAKTLLTALTSAMSKPLHAKDDKGSPKPKKDPGHEKKKDDGGVKK